MLIDEHIFRAHQTVRVGARIAAWDGGEGPVALLLHGYPQTHFMWRHVAKTLVVDRRVIMVDLRGYGASSLPGGESSTAAHAKREMALDVLRLLDELEVDACDVVGHDRGGRVAHRLALDAPDRVRSLAVLDIVPTLHMFEHVDRRMAEQYFHWFFLSRPGGLPERLIGADRHAWLRDRFAGRHAGGRPIEAEAERSYVEAFTSEVVLSTCADYRAAATVDLDHDREDRDAGRRVSAPLLALWGERSYVGTAFNPTAIWRSYADNVRGAAVAADHYLAEENPDATVAALRAFWAEVR